MYKWICKDKRDILQSKNVIRSKYLGNAREKEVVPKIYSNWIFVNARLDTVSMSYCNSYGIPERIGDF